MDYETLLKNAPPHDTEAFLDYLRANNPVVCENAYWLIIKNFKYPTWLTAFDKSGYGDCIHINELPHIYRDWEWLKKPADKQTVKRFHIHLIPPK